MEVLLFGGQTAPYPFKYTHIHVVPNNGVAIRPIILVGILRILSGSK